MDLRNQINRWKNICGMTTNCDVVRIALETEEEIKLLRERVHSLKLEKLSLEKENERLKVIEELFQQSDYVAKYYAKVENWNFRTFNEVGGEGEASRINKEDCEIIKELGRTFGGKLARKYVQIKNKRLEKL